jgi:hypothetical protein
MEQNFGKYKTGKDCPVFLKNGDIALRLEDHGWSVIKYCPWCGKEIEYIR